MNLPNLANQIQNILHLRESNAKDFESFQFLGLCCVDASLRVKLGRACAHPALAQSNAKILDSGQSRQLNAKYFGTVESRL
jgi:hypothetical protein